MLSKKLDTALDVKKWGDGALDRERLNLDYIYFELAEVKIKKKTTKKSLTHYGVVVQI